MVMFDGISQFCREVTGWEPPDRIGKVSLYCSSPSSEDDAHLLPPADAPRPSVSLIATVKNEASNIERWFDSIEQQSRPPDEIVIVDGGSEDSTFEKLRRLTEGRPRSIVLLQQADANIAAGRNLAIQHARGPIIACTDAGCELPPDWLSLITGPFACDPTLQVVGGYYESRAHGLFQQVVAAYLTPPVEYVDRDDFLPSSRSIAFTKSSWEHIGGYPEWLTLTGEDTHFDLELLSAVRGWAFVPEAIVRWRIQSSFLFLFKHVRRYGKGAGEAGHFPQEYVLKSAKLLGNSGACTALILAALALALIAESWFLLALAAVPGVLLLRVARPFFPPKVGGRPARSARVYLMSFLVLFTLRLAMIAGYIEGYRNRGTLPQPQKTLGVEVGTDSVADLP